MSTCRLLIGDVRETLAQVPDGSVQTCVTSPPFWGLRDYGTATWEGGNPDCEHGERRWDGPKQTQGAMSGHAAKRDRLDRERCHCGATRKDSQLGLEPTPEEYVANMVAVFREVRRVLRDDGVLWLNLGDSYCSTAPGTQGDPLNRRGILAGVSERRADASRKHRPETPPGLKPKDLVGIPWRVAFALQADGWYLRSAIVWHKPNPMPESVTDRPTSSYEHVFLLAKSASYYYDADAIAEPQSEASLEDHRKRKPSERSNGAAPDRGPGDQGLRMNGVMTSGTRNARNVWTITTKPYSSAHFATFPPELAERCIKAGSKPGDTVLDPFAGSGTTGMVATGHGRRAVLCELNPAYADLIVERVGPMLMEAA
jgi:DNA modification methylase